jgi:uncharacterized membrane protein YeaQ/YmgE (transglycosylase-associated protein family)
VNVLFFLAFGAMAGGVAKWLMPGKCPAGWLPTIALGVVGSFVGGLPFGGHPAGFVGSVIGACVVLFAYSIWSDDR